MRTQRTTAGILTLISAGLGIFGIIGCVFYMLIMPVLFNSPEYYTGMTQAEIDLVLPVMNAMLSVMIIGILVFMTLAVIGGIFALKRKNWGWALTGAIAATLLFFPCGLVAIIMIATAKPDFDNPVAAPGNIPDSPSTPNTFIS